MTNVTVQGNVTLLKNNAISASGVAIPPTDLEYGQIAINYNAKDPCIFIKVLGDNNVTSIQKFVGEEVIAKTLSDILGESAADLATLKELIEEFEGSSNDVLTLVKNIQEEVGNKANTSDLNAHKNNTSNPHSVTKAQVGLANVRDVAQLGQTETAADSSKLGGRAAADYWHKANSNLSTVDWNARNLTAVKGLFSGTSATQLTLERTSTNINNSITFKGSTITKYLGFSDGVLKISDSLDLSDVGNVTVWHSGNAGNYSSDWTAKIMYLSTGLHVTSDNKNWVSLANTSGKGGYIDLFDSEGLRGGILRGYAATNGYQMELLKGGISIAGTGKFSGDILINGTSADGIHKLLINGSAKANYYRFASRKTGFANVGYIGCGASDKDTVYLNGSEDVQIGSGARLDDITLSKTGTITVNKLTNFTDRILIGSKSAGSNQTPEYKDIAFNGAYGDYAWIRMPEVSVSSGEGRLEFWVRPSAGTSTTALPELAVRINGAKGVSFYNNILIQKTSIETPVRSVNSGSLFTFEDSDHNNSNAVLCGINAEGKATFWHRGAKDMIFGTSGTERIRVLSGGNVAIGKATADYKLDVNGGINADSSYYLKGTRFATVNTSGDIFLGTLDSGGGQLVFRTNGTERVKILANGNFGVGSSTPAHKFESKTDATTLYAGYFYNGSTAVSNGLYVRAGNDVNDKIALFEDRGGISAFVIKGNRESHFAHKLGVGTATLTDTLTVNGSISGTNTRLAGNSTGGYLQFKGVGNITGIGGTSFEKLITLSSLSEFRGDVIVTGNTGTYTMDGIETYAVSGVSRLSDLEDVDISGAEEGFVLYKSTDKTPNGDFIWKAKTAEKYWSDIHDKPTEFTPCNHNHIGSTYVTTPSDRRLKTDVETLNNPLNTILSINPVSYNWTTEAMERYGFKNHSSIGVIAQELEDIIPTAITQIDDQYKAVDYIQIIPFLVGAIKQLNDELANKNIAIANARKDYKKAYGESLSLKKEVDAIKIELNELKSLYKQTLN